MTIDNQTIHTAIHGNNLLWSCAFIDELVITPHYDLTYSSFTSTKFMSSAQKINIPDSAIENKIADVETFYTSKSKPISIYLDPAAQPNNLESILLAKGYQEDKSQEEVWWAINLDKFTTSLLANPDVTIVECTSRELFDDHIIAALRGYTDFQTWADQLSKNFGKTRPEVRIIHYVGYIDKQPVTCSTLGIYQEQGYLINTAVVPEHRKKGIHTTMMLRRIQDCQRFGVKLGFYQTDYDNEASIATGHKVGFTESFRRKLYFKDVIKENLSGNIINQVKV